LKVVKSKLEGVNHADIVVGDGGNSLLPYTAKRIVRFGPGVRTICYELGLPEELTSSYKLVILGTKASIKIDVSKSKKVRMCGPVPITTPTPFEEAAAMDVFGNYYSEDAIRIPAKAVTVSSLNGINSSNCGCDQLGFELNLFEPYFEDCIYGTGEGFDQQEEGPLRRAAFCAALVYLEGLIVPNESVCSPDEEKRVNVQVLPYSQPNDYPVSLAPIPESVLGYAVPFYRARHEEGISYSWPWRVINGGEYPFLEDFYHASVRLNFVDYTWHLDYDNEVGDGDYDLYSVILHELTHALGFISSFNSTAGALGSREGSGRYVNFDQHLQINYEDLPSPLNIPQNLIKNRASDYGYLFSNSWLFNPLVDGLGINDPNDPSDLHTSCSEVGTHVTFDGGISDYPIYAGEQFERGSSFSHLGDNCSPLVAEVANYVMKTSLESGNHNRRFHWQELDVFRTMGYNIDCSSADFIDDNPSDELTFDCNQADENCSIASVNDLSNNLDMCGASSALLRFGKCVGEEAININRLALENLLLANDPNTTQIAFIEPISLSPNDDWDVNETNFTFTTQSFGNFMFVYAPIDCNGGVANSSVFSLSIFLGKDCEAPPCENMDCSDFDFLVDWEECMNFPLPMDDVCNLICNGEFNGTYALNPSNNFVSNLNYRILDYSAAAYDPYHSVSTNFVGFSMMLSPTGWLKGTGTPDIIISEEANPSLRAGNRESAYTYLQSTPEVGGHYLFSGTFFETGTDPLRAPRIQHSISLIQAEFYTICADEPPGFFNVSCYAEGAPLLTIIDPDLYEYAENELSVRLGRCITVEENFDALLVKSSPFEEGFTSSGGIDDLELISDNFSAGVGLESPFCGTTFTLGRDVFCMLSDVRVQYDWYEVETNSNSLVHSYDVLNGVVNGDVSFQVAPQQTTTYRIVRSILEYGGLSDDFELCTISDEVTITVIEQFPIAEFTAQAVEGECGIYNYSSDPTTVGNEHTWYLNEQTEDAIFSTEENPVSHQLPDGVNTIIHVVEGRCGIDVFELVLPEVTCESPAFTCPCEGTDAINIDAGDGTKLSDLIASNEMPVNAVNSKCLAIKGHLLVDEIAMEDEARYSISFSEVRMQPGAKITVEAGAALLVNFSTNNGIHGCEALWEGISLSRENSTNEGGKLFLSGAIIEDAVYAVELGHGTTFDMVYTILNNNHIGIYSPPSLTEPQQIIQPTFPRQSTIRSTDELLDEYPGQVVRTGKNSYAGVELNDCQYFQIGGGAIDGISISDANYGVIARRSELNVRNSSIFNMIEDPTDGYSNTGIRVRSSWVDLQNSDIYNVRYGLFGRYSSLNARNNIFGESPLGNLGNVERGIWLYSGIGDIIEITNQNIFHIQDIGICLVNVPGANQTKINDNTIDVYNTIGYTLRHGSGILMGGSMVSGISEDEKEVVGNTINLHKFSVGINLWGVNATTVANNTVRFLASYNSFYPGTGISAHGGNDNYWYGNLVSAIGTTDNGVVGISLFDGDRNVFCCNTTEGTFWGMSFGGYCEGTKVRHTVFSDNVNSLAISRDSRIGEQIAAGNIWGESSEWQAIHHSHRPEDVIESRFFVSGNPGTETWPGNSFTHFEDVNWFLPGPVAPSCSNDILNCEEPELNLLALDERFAQKVLLGDFSYGDYPETSDWEAQRAFYRSQRATKIDDQINWPLASRLFFEQEEQERSELYKLISIEKSLENALLKDSLVNEIATRIKFLNDQLFRIDQSVEVDVEPSSEYIETRTALIIQKNEIFEIFSETLKQKNEDYLTLIDQLEQDNNDILTSVEAAQEVRTVNDWYFKTIARGVESLSIFAESELREIAEKCPQRFGSAVGRAQSILVHYGKPFVPSDECSKVVKGGGGKRKAGFLMSKDINIYPNPASSILNIQLPQSMIPEKYDIDLFDSRGKLIYSRTSYGGSFKFDVAEYPAGLYVIRVQSDEVRISKRVILQ
jgi:hypothetical protein